MFAVCIVIHSRTGARSGSNVVFHAVDDSPAGFLVSGNEGADAIAGQDGAKIVLRKVWQVLFAGVDLKGVGKRADGLGFSVKPPVTIVDALVNLLWQVRPRIAKLERPGTDVGGGGRETVNRSVRLRGGGD